jgi:hypothetical protein
MHGVVFGLVTGGSALTGLDEPITGREGTGVWPEARTWVSRARSVPAAHTLDRRIGQGNGNLSKFCLRALVLVSIADAIEIVTKFLEDTCHCVLSGSQGSPLLNPQSPAFTWFRQNLTDCQRFENGI